MDYELNETQGKKAESFEQFCREEIGPKAEQLASGQSNSINILQSLFQRFL